MKEVGITVDRRGEWKTVFCVNINRHNFFFFGIDSLFYFPNTMKI